MYPKIQQHPNKLKLELSKFGFFYFVWGMKVKITLGILLSYN